MYVNVKALVNDLDKKYQEFHARYAAAAEELNAVIKKTDEVRRSSIYTPAAKQDQIMQLHSREKKIRDELDAIQRESAAAFNAAKAEAHNSFSSFTLDPSAIDRNVLDLIDSGIMSAAEVTELVQREDYANKNHTMARLVGARMTKIADKMGDEHFGSEAERQSFASLGYSLSGVTSPVDSLIARYRVTAEAALRPDTDLGLNTHEQLYADALNAAKETAAQIDGAE